MILPEAIRAIRRTKYPTALALRSQCGRHLEVLRMNKQGKSRFDSWLRNPSLFVGVYDRESSISDIRADVAETIRRA